MRARRLHAEFNVMSQRHGWAGLSRCARLACHPRRAPTRAKPTLPRSPPLCLITTGAGHPATLRLGAQAVLAHVRRTSLSRFAGRRHLLAAVLVTFLAAGHVTERGVFLRTEHGHELAMVRGGAGWRSAAPLPNHLPRASALRTPCGMSSEVPARSAAQRARAIGTPLRVKRCAGSALPPRDAPLLFFCLLTSHQAPLATPYSLQTLLTYQPP